MKTEIIAITDRSLSMISIAESVIDGYNKFLQEQAAAPGEARMTYTQFDSEYEVVYEGIDIWHAPLLTDETFVPRHSTALLDAIGRTLNEQGKRIADENWADNVIVVIITDGFENCSRHFKQSQIKEMIKHAEQHKWSFIFLAANQDAFSTGATYGISAATTQNFVADAQGTSTAYRGASLMTTQIRSGLLNVQDAQNR